MSPVWSSSYDSVRRLVGENIWDLSQSGEDVVDALT